jgi:hypothetical protein
VLEIIAIVLIVLWLLGFVSNQWETGQSGAIVGDPGI